MEVKITLNIEFNDFLTDEKLDEFTDKLIDLIGKFNLLACGGNDYHKLNWVIASVKSHLIKGEIIDEIGIFLIKNEAFVLNFEMY
jgi:uncharacterized protein YggL (DUF469 family)